LTDDLLERRQWGFCPACDQVSQQEGQGRLIIRGTGLAPTRALIRSRIENVARRAMVTQPERRIVSIDAIESKDEPALEVLTTSQKLTHRIAHELKKVFGGRTSYNWSDDGTLFAIWELERRKPKEIWELERRKPKAKKAGRHREGLQTAPACVSVRSRRSNLTVFGIRLKIACVRDGSR
jgi:hypothetical protein